MVSAIMAAGHGAAMISWDMHVQHMILKDSRVPAIYGLALYMTWPNVIIFATHTQEEKTVLSISSVPCSATTLGKLRQGTGKVK